MQHDLSIPDFLCRKLNPHLNRTYVERATREKKVSAREQLDRDVARIARRRWVNGEVDQHGGRRFQQYRTIAKQVRAELKARDRKQAGRTA